MLPGYLPAATELSTNQAVRRRICACYNAVAGASASLMGMTLLVGGLRVLLDPDMRPPRLPDRRPPRWVLPAVGALWLGAGLWLPIYAFSQKQQNKQAITQQRLPHALITPALTTLAFPGFVQVVFELTRLAIASRRPGPTQAVVVLGCALRGDEPSPLLKRRLIAAERVVEASHQEVTVVCSGGVGNDAHTDSTRAEADVMVQWLANRRAERQEWASASSLNTRLVAENDARNTVENIEYSRRLIPVHCEDITVVTSDFHVIRVRRLLREAGLGNWRVVGAYTPLKYWATSILREFLAQFVLWAPATKYAGSGK